MRRCISCTVAILALICAAIPRGLQVLLELPAGLILLAIAPVLALLIAIAPFLALLTVMWCAMHPLRYSRPLAPTNWKGGAGTRPATTNHKRKEEHG
jgi:hypothetical protein